MSMAISNLDPNLNTILISVIISLVSLLYKEHKFFKKRIRALERKMTRLERRINGKR